jgi:hypothetical protein
MTPDHPSDPDRAFGPTPPDVAALDRLLRHIQFEPRASLDSEVRGRLERAVQPEIPERSWLRPTLGLLILALALGGALAWFWGIVVDARPHRTVDRCCWDLDGGGVADDGVTVTTDRRGRVRAVAVYEDPDGNGRFDRADTVRFRRTGAPVLAPAPARASAESGTREMVTREVCCADLDGGGRPDDAVLVMGHPPNVLTMVAIVERGGGGQQSVPLR